MKTRKKLAVFDIDGTLYKWQLFHELVEELTLSGVFPKQAFHRIDEGLNDWRMGKVSFDTYERLVVKALFAYLPQTPIAQYETACDAVIAASGHKLNNYPKQLLKQLQSEGYMTIAISGSQQELLKRFGELHGFDVAIGAEYERRGDYFTGKVLRPTIGYKAGILHELLEVKGVSLKGSVAIGDSEGDIELLAMVENPIAYNPSEGLFREATKQRWPIVIERKNIAYKMEHKDDALVLAETIIY